MEFIGILCNVYFEKNFLSVEILVKLFIVVLVFEKKKKRIKFVFCYMKIFLISLYINYLVVW